MKFRNKVTLELPVDDVCKLLSEAICVLFGPFEHMEVLRVTRTEHGKFRLDLYGKQLRQPAASVVTRPKVAA